MDSQLLYLLCLLFAWAIVIRVHPFLVVETAAFADRAIRGVRFDLDAYVYDAICDELQNDMAVKYTLLENASASAPIHAY